MKWLILIAASVLVSGVRSECISTEAMAAAIDRALEILEANGPEVVSWEPVHKDRLFRISTGEIFGLKNMKRVADPKIECLENRFAAVKVTVEMKNVRIVYPWEFKHILKLKGKVFGGAEYIRSDAYFLRSSDEKDPLIFNKFDITEVGPVETRVTGANYLTYITSYFMEHISNILKNAVGDTLEKQVGHTLCGVLNSVDGIRKIIDNIDK